MITVMQVGTKQRKPIYLKQLQLKADYLEVVPTARVEDAFKFKYEDDWDNVEALNSHFDIVGLGDMICHEVVRKNKTWQLVPTLKSLKGLDPAKVNAAQVRTFLRNEMGYCEVVDGVIHDLGEGTLEAMWARINDWWHMARFLEAVHYRGRPGAVEAFIRKHIGNIVPITHHTVRQYWPNPLKPAVVPKKAVTKTTKRKTTKRR